MTKTEHIESLEKEVQSLREQLKHANFKILRQKCYSLPLIETGKHTPEELQAFDKAVHKTQVLKKILGMIE